MRTLTHVKTLQRKWIDRAFFGTMLGGVALSGCLLAIGERAAGQIALFGACIIAIAAVALTKHFVNRFRRRLLGNAGLLCPHCRYALWGLTPSGTCPECGRAYTFRSAQEHWARSMDMPELLADEEE